MAENFSEPKETPAVTVASIVTAAIAGGPLLIGCVVVGMFAGFIYSGVRGYSIEDMMKFTSIGAVAGLLAGITFSGIFAETFLLEHIFGTKILTNLGIAESIAKGITAVGNTASAVGLALKGQFTFIGLGYDFNDNLLLHFGSESIWNDVERGWNKISR